MRIGPDEARGANTDCDAHALGAVSTLTQPFAFDQVHGKDRRWG